MKILVIGSGGREHALAWKLSQSPNVERVYVAPGNAGTAQEPGITNVDIAITDFEGLAKFCDVSAIDLTVVGPEGPLVNGIVDFFHDKGLRCFGPNQAAAQLEGSKAFSKAFMQRHNIPTGHYKVFESLDAALTHINEIGAPLVIKADGLAAGKGVFLAHTIAEAKLAATEILGEQAFGEAGSQIIIEEFLFGEEVSFICMVGKGEVIAMATSQDHKARDEGDVGPNTGGMGAYSPAPIVDASLHQRIMRDVINPTINGLRDEGIEYCGFLYAGLMIDGDGIPQVLEYNCRFGDPETQPIMMRLDSDLLELCNLALDGGLNQTNVRWNTKCALGVVMAADGYPFGYATGLLIEYDQTTTQSECKVFHAGTRLENKKIVTSGGRVLCVTALGNTVQEASQRAYRECEKIRWDNAYYRKDIGHKAITRETAK